MFFWWKMIIFYLLILKGIIMGIAEAITAFFTFADTVFKKALPEWLQRRKTEYFKLLGDYNEEWNKPVSGTYEDLMAGLLRNGPKADQLRIDLETFSKVFWKELQENSAKGNV